MNNSKEISLKFNLEQCLFKLLESSLKINLDLVPVQAIVHPPPQDLGKAEEDEHYGFAAREFGDASDLLETLGQGIIPQKGDDDEGDSAVKPEEDAMLDLDMKFDD